MPSFLKTTLYFTKHNKYFDKFNPFCFCFCYASHFKNYSLLHDNYRFLFPQPFRRRRRRYFKYDLDFWTDGLEGYRFKPRITNFTHSRLRVKTFKNLNFCKSYSIFTDTPNAITSTYDIVLHSCEFESASSDS